MYLRVPRPTTPAAEGGEVRYSYGYGSGLARLADYNATPGEHNGRLLAGTEKDTALTSARIPLAPGAQHLSACTSGP